MRLEYSPGFQLSFPGTRCCNCGATGNLSVEAQETKLTRYFGVGGTEITLQFPLVTCALCRRSLKRRPPTIFTRFLMWLAIAGVFFLLAVTVGEGALGASPMWVSENLLTVSLAVSAGLLFGLSRLRQPKGDQSTFYQPVRLRALSREFNSPYIEGLWLDFTNRAYLRDFQMANAQAIQNGQIRADAVK